MLAASAFPSPSAFTQGSSSFSSAPPSPVSVAGPRFDVPVDLSDPDQDHDTSNDNPEFRPFHVPGMPQIRRHKYSTSLDDRGYIPVYEFMIGEFPVMWDRETGFVHFTGIWKALYNQKTDIVRVVDYNPNLNEIKIRGGFLRIQGTWIPYDSARALCRQNAYPIRHYLRPLFGPDFAEECIPPSHPHFGSLLLDPASGGSTRVSAAARRVSKTIRPRRKSSRATDRSDASSLSPRRSSRSAPYPERSNSCSTRRSSCQEHHSDSTSVSSRRSSRQKTDRVASRMALSRFLNCDTRSRTRSSVSSMETDDDMSVDVESPTTTPSPTYPKAFVPYVVSDTGPQLPPLRSSDQDLPRVLPAYVPVYLGGPDQLVPVSHDTLDAVRAASVLLRMSQDTGEKPYRPLRPLPKRVVHDDRAFWICWDN